MTIATKRDWTDFDRVGAIIAHESGELDNESTIELFQHLVDTGLAFQLQGHYGRAAMQLIDRGLVAPNEHSYPTATLDE